MEVHLTPEQQAQLAQIAAGAGTAPERLATRVVARYLDEDEMDAGLEAMFKAW